MEDNIVKGFRELGGHLWEAIILYPTVTFYKIPDCILNKYQFHKTKLDKSLQLKNTKDR